MNSFYSYTSEMLQNERKDFLEHNLCDFYVFQCNWSNESQLMTIYDEFSYFIFIL